MGLQILIVVVCLSLLSCKQQDSDNDIWIYGSIYKDTIADIEPQLKQKFPELTFHFYQAGSEEIAAKVNAETLAGGTKADMVIFSDRFWYEEAAQNGKLHSYRPQNSDKVPMNFRHPEGYYAAVSLPLMVMIYNSDVMDEKEAPKTFKEMADEKWKGKFATGSPLASGTNFTTVAFLEKKYGWEYFRSLRKNDTISEGGNSAVIRRVQTKERPVGWVLLENVLRLKADSNIKVIYPEDGAVVQSNVLAIIKKSKSRRNSERVADWFFSEEGQAAMVRSHMYAAVTGVAAPKGAKELSKVLETAPAWTPEILKEIMQKREEIKEEFTDIMFH